MISHLERFDIFRESRYPRHAASRLQEQWYSRERRTSYSQLCARVKGGISSHTEHFSWDATFDLVRLSNSNTRPEMSMATLLPAVPQQHQLGL